MFAVPAQVNVPTQAQLLQDPESVSQLLNDASGPLSSYHGLAAFEKAP